MLGGYGSCGRPLCCTTLLQSFEPVSIKMAKQQDLSLNPSKLSGLCGRLKCCLRYELPNGKGVKHGGCGDEGGCASCSNPTGPGGGGGGCGTCGSGGCGTCGVTDAAAHRRSPSAIPPASVPRSRARPRRDPARARRLRAVLYGPSRPSELARVRAGRVSADGRPRRVRRDRRAPSRDAQARPDRRDRDGADQQGGVRRRRAAVARPHRSARAPDRRAARRDDVLLRGAARRAGDGAHRRSPRCRAR